MSGTIHHKLDGEPTCLGLPVQRGLNVFHWAAEIEGRPATRSAPLKTTGHKSAADILAFKVAGSISFSKNTQADADKTARLAGRNNSSRSQ